MYTTYTLLDFCNSENDPDEYHLTAKTDTGARRQAKKIIQKSGLLNPKLYFRRNCDSCEGMIDL